MEYPNIADCDPVAHEVQVNLHVLRPLMLDGVGERAVELRQELS